MPYNASSPIPYIALFRTSALESSVSFKNIGSSWHTKPATLCLSPEKHSEIVPTAKDLWASDLFFFWKYLLAFCKKIWIFIIFIST